VYNQKNNKKGFKGCSHSKKQGLKTRNRFIRCMKTGIALFGVLILSIVLAGCVIESPPVGGIIPFNQATVIRLNETRNLEDNSVSLLLTKIALNPSALPNAGAPAFGGTATFKAKNLLNDTEQEFSIKISFPEYKRIGLIEYKTIPFTDYRISVFGNGDSRNDNTSVTIVVETTENQQQWLSIKPIQCQENPWEKWYAEGNIQFLVEPTEKQLITAFYGQDYNIEILDYREVPAPPGSVSCEACTCQRGDTIFVLVKNENAPRMVQLGWRITTTPPEPIACTMDAKICPDGTAVGRIPPDCEFAPCPNETCVSEGESIPVIANPPVCCSGLQLIQPKNPNIVGSAGTCTAKCGNGVCDSDTENNYNCATDCSGNGIANPASEYCIQEGGSLADENCSFGTVSCNEWDFFRGKCGQEFTSCAKAGFEVKNVSEIAGDALMDYGLCITPDKNCTLQEFNRTCT
jgi:putative hemolysin